MNKKIIIAIISLLIIGGIIIFIYKNISIEKNKEDERKRFWNGTGSVCHFKSEQKRNDHFSGSNAGFMVCADLFFVKRLFKSTWIRKLLVCSYKWSKWRTVLSVFYKLNYQCSLCICASGVDLLILRLCIFKDWIYRKKIYLQPCVNVSCNFRTNPDHPILLYL